MIPENYFILISLALLAWIIYFFEFELFLENVLIFSNEAGLFKDFNKFMKKTFLNFLKPVGLIQNEVKEILGSKILSG